MKSIGVLIISDIHMTDKQYGRRAGQSKFKENEEFYDRFELYFDRNISNDIDIRYVLLLGDASDYALKTEFEEVTTILNKICSHMNINKENVLIIPGNHDMSRIGFWSYCYKNKIKEEDYAKYQAAKFEDFKEFYDGFYNKETIRFDPDKAITRVLFAREMNIVFVGINSIYKDTFREEDHHGYINYSALRDELGEVREEYPNHNIIALMHHTPENLGGSGSTIENWNNILTIFNRHNVNIYIGAHAHTNDGVRTVTVDGDRQYLTNGSLSASEENVDSAFTVLKYCEAEKELKVLPYKYISDWLHGYWNYQSDQDNTIREIKLT